MKQLIVLLILLVVGVGCQSKISNRKPMSDRDCLKQVICAQMLLGKNELVIIDKVPLCATDLRNIRCELFLSIMERIYEEREN